MTEPFDPTKTIVYWNRTLTLALNRYLERQATPDKREKIPEIQAMTLGYLYRHQDQVVLQKDLEQHLQIRKSTTSTLVQRMLAKGLLATQPAPQDSRAKQLLLTDLARQRIHQIDTSAREVERHLRQGISDADLATFLRVIWQIKKNTD